MIEEKKSFWKKVLYIFLHKLFNNQRRFIKKYIGKNKSNKIAVYYHKFIAKEERNHANNQRVKCIIESLTNLGYVVYLIHKQCSSIPKSIQRMDIDLFIGIDGCGGGKYFFQHLEELNAKRNFLLQTVQPPALLRRRLKKRKQHREKYLKIFDDYTRPISLEEEKIYYKNINKVETLIFPNSTDDELNSELNSLGVKIKRIDWNTFKEVDYIRRDKTSEIQFICMNGNDPFRKGIDYAIHIFSELPYKLQILAPENERLIIEKLIDKYSANNISYYGFLDIASNKFKELAAKAMFCINFSVSESQANAMLHAMKTGLIPIIDKDSGSFDYKYGLILDIMNESFDITRKKLVDYVEAFSWAEYQRQSKYIAKFIKNNHNYELFKRQFLESLK